MEFSNLAIIYSCEKPFDNIDLAVYFQSDNKNDFDYWTRKIFDGLEREVFFTDCGAWVIGTDVIYKNSGDEIKTEVLSHEDFHVKAKRLNLSSSTNITLEEAMAEVIGDLSIKRDRSDISKRVRDYWCSALASRSPDILDGYVGVENFPASKWLKLAYDARYSLYYELCMSAVNRGADTDRFFDALGMSKYDLSRGVDFLLSFSPELREDYNFTHRPVFYPTRYKIAFVNNSISINAYTSDINLLEKVKKIIVPA